MSGLDRAIASVVVPAHDEAAQLRRNLPALLEGAPPVELVVVCNGCTDDSVVAARTAAPGAVVLDVPVASKTQAVRAGNAATDVFPRVHLDADVELSGSSLRALLAPVVAGDALAAAPRRVLDAAGAHPVVRWYYEVWEALPQVSDGLFGRGVFVLSREGQHRVDRLPQVMSDDLAVSEAFAPHERTVVPGAVAVVRTPRSVRDLLRRRVRVVVGNREADALGVRSADSATGLRTLASLAAARPALALRLPVFVIVTVAARVLAARRVRRGTADVWLRDESSRAA